MHSRGCEEAGATSLNCPQVHQSEISLEVPKPSSEEREFNNEENTTGVSYSVIESIEVDKSRQTQAAILIQTAFRGYLVISLDLMISICSSVWALPRA
jgi:hypothetical protein